MLAVTPTNSNKFLKRLTLPATLAEQGRPTRWLFTTPHNGAFVRGKPNPSLMSHTTVRDIRRHVVGVLALPILLRLAHTE